MLEKEKDMCHETQLDLPMEMPAQPKPPQKGAQETEADIPEEGQAELKGGGPLLDF